MSSPVPSLGPSQVSPLRRVNMRINARLISAIAVVSLVVLLSITFRLPVVQGAADHVRWDIIHMNPATTPATLTPGGVAFASARNPSTLSIKLTGSGTFVAPASGGTSSAVTGGGTWEMPPRTTHGQRSYRCRVLERSTYTRTTRDFLPEFE